MCCGLFLRQTTPKAQSPRPIRTPHCSFAKSCEPQCPQRVRIAFAHSVRCTTYCSLSHSNPKPYRTEPAAPPTPPPDRFPQTAMPLRQFQFSHTVPVVASCVRARVNDMTALHFTAPHPPHARPFAQSVRSPERLLRRADVVTTARLQFVTPFPPLL